MRANFYFFTFLVFVLFITSCVPNTDTQSTEINLSLADTELQKIIDLQDKQDISGLYTYFRSPDPAYRYYSVLAFGSIKNVVTNDSLFKMLKDPVLEVRAAAAYALGQTGNTKITDRIIAAFNGRDTLEVDNIYNANILEAVGKTGNESDLKAIATVKTYRSTDTFLLLGQMRSIYNFSLRKIITDEGTSRVVDLLYQKSIPSEVRTLAASYLGRNKTLNLSLFKVRLIEVFSREDDPNIRMALALAFGNSKDIDFLPTLKSRLITETDYRVKCNIVRAMANFPYAEVRDILLSNLKNDNIHIASTAADAILINGIVEDVPEYVRYDTIGIPWQVRAKMNGAVLTHTALYFTKSKTAFSQRVLKNLKESTDDYAKAAYVNALSRDPYNYILLGQLYTEEKSQIVKIATLEGLGNILRNPLFFKAFGNGFGRVKGEILATLISAVSSGDVGQIAVASTILKEPSLIFKEWIRDPAFMKEALAKLTLPRDIESYNELKSAISYIEGTKFEPEVVKHNHPIDWTFVQLSSDTTVAAIKTSQGLIRVKLDRINAPATVANFIALVNEKFYNNKIFHRVVPNFVVQTGCPRGDGYGSQDYTIRSELPQKYFDSEGYIGMASAGNHTESTQWFITHSPAPHLNGNYTIFGKVVEGMDIVHKIQVGDKINEIILVK
ncbi:MAG TPA: peptidylprolyl isomerase [Saprospiraceae bacterium]|nr:peptidylprolyl isomerase [Saprospiraceae bacterium]HMU03134.1 peptidylprolyl isomerase [Saprospiraceae bacterium]